MSPPSVSFRSTLHRIFAIARDSGEKLALVSETESLTYAELKTSSVRLAEVIKLGTLANHSPIAICAGDSGQMILAALAAWQTGHPYLPLNPEWPEERNRDLLHEAGAELVLFERSYGSNIPVGPWISLELDDLLEEGRRSNAYTLAGHELIDTSNWEIDSASIAYVLYTSGSTGKPKGVAVTHANLSNLVDWYEQYFSIGPADRIAQLAALTFDVSIGEIWPTLSLGATLYTPNRDRCFEPRLLHAYLLAEKITFCEVATVLVEKLFSLDWPKDGALRYLHTGGDVLRVFPPETLPFQVINGYGPTECTDTASAGVVPPRSTGLPALGWPILNTQIYILDSNLKPLLPGQPGEIVIGGAGVAAGYLNRPDLTAERFITLTSIPAAGRIYRTGDLGYIGTDGQIHFLGRMDSQIKLRGLRIEPNEIIQALRADPGVSEVHIATSGEGEERSIIAYIVLAQSRSVEEIRKHLADRIPTYMVPQHIMFLDRLPLTLNGKLDQHALPLPVERNKNESLQGFGAAVPKLSDTEQSMLCIWEEVLSPGASIAVDDDFFLLGGHSLLAARIINRIEQIFRKRLPLSAILRAPTVRQLSALVEMPANIAEPESNLVLLSSNGERTPFHIIHAIGGSVLIYKNLARRISNRSVYGLGVALPAGADSSEVTVSTIAESYIRSIRAVQKRGPYYVAGYSAGGTLAVEMVEQLTAAGEEALLVLLDASVAEFPTNLFQQGRWKDGALMLWHRSKQNGRELARSGIRAYSANKLRGLAFRLHLGLALQKWIHWANAEHGEESLVDDRLYHALRRYAPQPIKSQVIMFRTTGSIAENYHPAFGWTTALPSGIAMYDVPGEHMTLLHEPNVETIANLLNACLEKADSEICVPSPSFIHSASS